MPRIAYLGPPGTFSEEALLTQPDLADGDLLDLPTFPEVLAAEPSTIREPVSSRRRVIG